MVTRGHISNCKTYDELILLFTRLPEGTNIEGSRGILYSSEKITRALVKVEEGAKVNYLTRSLGIRRKAMELLNKFDQSFIDDICEFDGHYD